MKMQRTPCEGFVAPRKVLAVHHCEGQRSLHNGTALATESHRITQKKGTQFLLSVSVCFCVVLRLILAVVPYGEDVTPAGKERPFAPRVKRH